MVDRNALFKVTKEQLEQMLKTDVSTDTLTLKTKLVVTQCA